MFLKRLGEHAEVAFFFDNNNGVKSMAIVDFFAPKRLNGADSYDEWVDKALSVDARTGMDKWKKVAVDSRYDYRRIRDRREMLKHARESGDERELLFVLNEGIHGNLGGIANPALYNQAMFGTKDLITEYMAEIEMALEHLAETPDDVIPFEERLDFFRRASHCYGRSALMLSGAGSLTPFHFGVVQALLEQDVLPEVISGSSGGAFVAALLGTRTTKEMKAAFKSLETVDKAFFWEDEEMGGKPSRETATAEYLQGIITNLIPDMTFEEAYDRSGLYINISVATSQANQKSRLLNVITCPHVYVREAVMASCAVPGIMPPVQLAAKDFKGRRKPYLPELKWIDGAVSDDLPARRLARLYGVNHFIASQTNPIVLWALNSSKIPSGTARAALDWGTQVFRANLRATQKFTNFMTKGIPSLNSLSHIFYSVALQEYTADVTIMPSRRLYDLRKALSRATRQEMFDLALDGQKASWPELERIRNSTRVSMCLTEILDRYEHESEHRHEVHKLGSNRARSVKRNGSEKRSIA